MSDLLIDETGKIKVMRRWMITSMPSFFEPLQHISTRIKCWVHYFMKDL